MQYLLRVLLSLYTGVEMEKINGLMVGYTLARVGYAVSYVLVETETWSWARTACWWAGNISLTMLGMA